MLEEASKAAVVVRGVSKTYLSGDSQVYALRRIDLVTETNKLLMITGPSGCGKTTLLSIIAGTLPFNEGEVILFGKSLSEMDEDELTIFRRKNVGFVFQQFQLIKSISVLDNVTVPLILNGFKYNEARARSSVLLNKFGLGKKMLFRPGKLSGGEQQRVAIARALVHEPTLMICDEPTASLDHETGTRVMELIKEVAMSENRSVIIVTHDNRIFKYADKIVKMDDGVIVENRNV